LYVYFERISVIVTVSSNLKKGCNTRQRNTK